MRAVLDTNVLLAAFFTRGVCEAIFDAAIERGAFGVVLSEHILGEFARHAEGKFGGASADVKAAVGLLRANAEMVRPAGVPGDACKDKDDLPVLGTAVAGHVDALVTGDAELIALGAIEGIPIVPPRTFYERICAG